MITAIAIDDEPQALNIIKNHAAKVEQLNLVATFYDAQKAVLFIQKNPIDLIFLDINMPKMSGMDLLDNIQSNPFVIFTTAYSKFAVDSYNYNAIDYLLKPFEFDRFQLAVDKVYEQLNATIKNKTFFFIKDGFKTVKIMFDQILFIKGSGNYLDIITEEGRHSPRMTFESIIAKVPPVNFIRIHQSYLVNLSKIEKIEHNHVFMGKHQIPISHRYKMALFKRLEL